MKALCWFAALAGVWCGAALADEPADRARLAAERTEVEARYSERAKACQDNFFVTACVDAAHKDRREALDRIRVQQQALDDADRKQRAAERLRRIHEKVGAQSAASAAPTRALREPKQRLPVASLNAHGGAAKTVTSASAPRAVKNSEQAAGHRVTAEQARQRQAAEHREAVEKRRIERTNKRPRAAPLPVPTASAIR